jgi:hypothetical protein
MDDSRTRLNLSSQTQDYAPNRRFLSTPKIGFLEEYQDVPYPHAAKLDPRSTKKPGCAHGWCGFMMEWWWEVFTWLIGSAAFITIVALLIVFGNQPLNHWRLPKIQITTTVAALAQTAVSALIVSVSSCIGQLKWVWFGRNRPLLDIQGFDDSSRGPAGSSLLLWNFLWKKRRP